MTRHLAQLMIALALFAAAVASWMAATTLTRRAGQAERVMTFQERPDRGSLLETANASFREAQRDSAGVIALERLDQVLQAYAGALKNEAFSRDAAYNFEYVARLRDATARRARRAPVNPAPQSESPDDLPRGPTLHGTPGHHPSGTRGEEFEVITPLDYGEREAQPEPTPGRPLPRKG